MLSARDRATVTNAWGDRAVIANGDAARGRFEQPQAEAGLAQGTSPTFTASADALDAIGLDQASARGKRIERVDTYQGRTFGPYTVRGYESIGDGAFAALALEQTT